MVRLHAESAPPSPRDFASQVPDDLALVVQRALEKDPARRYASAGEFGAALAAVLESGGLSQEAGRAPAGAGSRPGWSTFLSWRGSREAWKDLLRVGVPLGLPGISLPFGLLLALQFLLSFALALAFLYGLVLLTR